MKQNTFLSLVAIALSLFAISCSTTYDASPETKEKHLIRNSMQGRFSAEVNGMIFTAHNKFITVEPNGNNTSFVSISGIQDSYDKDPNKSETISFTIPEYTGPKTYLSDANIAGAFIKTDTSITWSYTTLPGDTLSSITITSDQGNWEGTFNLLLVPSTQDAQDIIVISNGSFSIPK